MKLYPGSPSARPTFSGGSHGIPTGTLLRPEVSARRAGSSQPRWPHMGSATKQPGRMA